MKVGLSVGLALVFCQGAFAIVAAPIGSSTPTDSVYTFVGEIQGSASAVAIGPRTVLTSAHVGVNNFILNGQTYNFTTWSFAPTVNNPSGVGTTNIDLLLINLDRDLPGFYNIAPTVAPGATVTMVGYADGGQVNNTLNGYTIVGPNHVRRAGTNTLSSVEFVEGIGMSEIAYLTASPQAALVNGDSGGGFFVGNQLVGINSFVFNDSWDGDPTHAPLLPDYGFANRNTGGFTIPGTTTFVPPGTPYFGSGAVDVTNSVVRNWITANAVPEPTTMLALGAGAVALLRRRKARR